MKNRMLMFAVILGSLLLIMPGAARLNAQITNDVRAHIDHSFVIGNTTLPPGDYMFRTMHNTDLHVMTAASDDGKTAVNFIVREAVDDHTPAHTELIFRKYGNTEFLDKIFESGTKIGAAVTETSREEEHLVKTGQQPTEQREEQK